jgi:hypothetical protein
MCEAGSRLLRRHREVSKSVMDPRELESTRARQRFTLRMIPDWLVEQVAPLSGVSPVKIAEQDKTLAEWVIRERADRAVEALENVHPDLLATCEASTRAVLAYEVARPSVNTQPYDPRRILIDELGIEKRDRYLARLDKDDFDSVGVALSQAVFLLRLADHLSDDGYRDSRLPDG